MEPDDAYLCIVPAGRPSTGGGQVFLPFEDERLSLVLSKAFLLAADTKITDETIPSDQEGRLIDHPARLSPGPGHNVTPNREPR
jgi:hypothetical protein